MSWDVGHDGAQDHAPTRRDCAQSALTVLYVGTASAGGGKVVRLCVQGQALMCKDAKSKELDEMSLGICGSSSSSSYKQPKSDKLAKTAPKKASISGSGDLRRGMV